MPHKHSLKIVQCGTLTPAKEAGWEALIMPKLLFIPVLPERTSLNSQAARAFNPEYTRYVENLKLVCNYTNSLHTSTKIN